jgi:hypothetical protein
MGNASSASRRGPGISTAQSNKLAAVTQAQMDAVPGLVDKVINAQTGTTYTLAASDAYERGTSLVTLSNASPITVTIPKNASVAIAVGQTFNFIQKGAGQVAFAAEDGAVTINPSTTLKISAQWKGVTAIQVAANVWDLIGSLSA